MNSKNTDDHLFTALGVSESGRRLAPCPDTGSVPSRRVMRLRRRRSCLRPAGLLLVLLITATVDLRGQTAEDAETVEGVDGDSFHFENTPEEPVQVPAPSPDPTPQPSPTPPAPQPVLPPAPVLPPGDGNGVEDTYLWLGAGVGAADWNDPDNWYPYGVPDRWDTAIFTDQGQNSWIDAGEIWVGTLVYDDSLTEDFKISADIIHIENGLQMHWNLEVELHHAIYVAQGFYVMERSHDGTETGYYQYQESSTLDGLSFTGSTRELFVGADYIDLYDQVTLGRRSPATDFEAGVQDEVGEERIANSRVFGEPTYSMFPAGGPS